MIAQVIKTMAGNKPKMSILMSDRHQAAEATLGRYSSFSKVVLIANLGMPPRLVETGGVKLEAVLEINRGNAEENGLQKVPENKNPPTLSGDFISHH